MDKKEGTLLIVDDNQSVLNSLNLFLKYKFEKVINLNNPNNISGVLNSENISLVLLDMNFSAGINSGNEGLYWLNRILELSPDSVVVLITAYGDSELAVKAIKSGAFDFIEKPWNNEKLLTTLKAAYEFRKSKLKVKSLEQKQKVLNEHSVKEIPFITSNPEAMAKVLDTIYKVSKTDVNVLILGENGTGKELIAQKIHQLSNRKDEIFMSVDMAALSETLFESELFGHCKGSFTDAKEDRMGKFEAASGGTLFLDEIGNLSYPMQAKLLTALQNREISKIGSNSKTPIDIRLISATNKDIMQLLSEKLFREDLLYRVNTVQITLPPLRERLDDIVVLAEYFLELFSVHYNKRGLKIDGRALDKILAYHWPGNIRELKHTIEKGVILCDKNILSAEDFFFDKSICAQHELGKVLSLEEGEKVLIENALKRNNWNISEAAKELDIGRQTLYRKIEKYKI